MVIIYRLVLLHPRNVDLQTGENKVGRPLQLTTEKTETLHATRTIVGRTLQHVLCLPFEKYPHDLTIAKEATLFVKQWLGRASPLKSKIAGGRFITCGRVGKHLSTKS